MKENGTECFQIHINKFARGGPQSGGSIFSGACSVSSGQDDRIESGRVVSVKASGQTHIGFCRIPV